MSVQCELGDNTLGDPDWIREQGSAASYVDQGEAKKTKLTDTEHIRDEDEEKFAADIAAKIAEIR